MLTKSQRILVSFMAWAFLVLGLLSLFQIVYLEYFIVFCLFGFLVIAELSGPYTARPKWRTRVNVVILACVLVFGYIVVSKVIQILNR